MHEEGGWDRVESERDLLVERGNSVCIGVVLDRFVVSVEEVLHEALTGPGVDRQKRDRKVRCLARNQGLMLVENDSWITHGP